MMPLPTIDTSHIRRQVELCREVAEQIQTDPVATEKMRTSAKRNFGLLKFSLNTVEKQLPRQILNGAFNGQIKRESINDIKNIGKEKKVLCLAFGPSISDSLEHAKEKAKDAIVIMCDIGVKWFMDHGISPDYIVTLDASIDTEYLGEYPLDGVTLLAHTGANYRYIQKAKKLGAEIVLFNIMCRFNTQNILRQCSGVEEAVFMSGNVSQGMAYAALEIMRSEDVELYGYDYCWTDCYYPDGRKYNRDIISDIEKGKAYYAIDRNGADCYTTIQLLFYRDILRDYIIANGHVGKVKNMSAGGILNLPISNGRKELCTN